MRFERVTTKHGIPLYVLSMPHVMSVASGILVFAGSRDEKWPQQAGLAHATEHMLFQGNSHKPNSLLITEEIEAEGGDLNAWTSSEMTFYHNVVPDFAFATSIRSLAHEVTSPLFEESEIRKEMLNILEEFKRSNDSPSRVASEVFQKIAYGNHPLSKRTLGIEETVKNFKTEDFLRWQKQYYHPANYAGIVVGNVTPAQALEVFNEHHFGRTGGAPRTLAIDHAHTPPATKVVEKDIEQANICLGTTIGPGRDPQSKALEIYSTMLSGGMSFPLFQEVRDKRGLCYAIRSDITRWSDRGIFEVYVGTDKNRITEAVDCIKDVVWKCKDDEQLFEKAKKASLGGLCVGFNSPGGIIGNAAAEIIFSGAPKTPEEMRKEIESIQFSDVTKAVEQYLNPEKFSYALVVPKGTVVKL